VNGCYNLGMAWMFVPSEREALKVLADGFCCDPRTGKISKINPDYVPLGLDRFAFVVLLDGGWTLDFELRDAVYPAGKIAGQTDAGCNDWRSQVRAELEKDFDVLDPMVRDMRGIKMTPEQDAWMIKMDKADIAASCGVVIRADDGPSYGTCMEIHFAATLDEHINVAFTGQMNTSPWLRAHVDHYCPELKDACAWLRKQHADNQAKRASPRVWQA